MTTPLGLEVTPVWTWSMKLAWSTVLEGLQLPVQLVLHIMVLCIQVTDLKYIKVRPFLLRKGDMKVALYDCSGRIRYIEEILDFF